MLIIDSHPVAFAIKKLVEKLDLERCVNNTRYYLKDHH